MIYPGLHYAFQAQKVYTCTRILKHFEVSFLHNYDGFVKSRESLENVIPAKAGISKFNYFWMPDQVRHDGFGTFYEIVNYR